MRRWDRQGTVRRVIGRWREAFPRTVSEHDMGSSSPIILNRLSSPYQAFTTSVPSPVSGRAVLAGDIAHWAPADRYHWWADVLFDALHTPGLVAEPSSVAAWEMVNSAYLPSCCGEAQPV